MKFKVGDKVYVKKDLIDEHEYGTVPFIEEMRKYCGTIVTISKVGRYSYDIMEDGAEYAWSDEMLEPVTFYNIYVYNDVIKISCNNSNYKEYNNIDDDSIIFALQNFMRTKKWKPKNGETYYTFNIGYGMVGSAIWEGNTYENLIYNKGLVFKTEEKAREVMNSIVDLIKNMEC